MLLLASWPAVYPLTLCRRRAERASIPSSHSRQLQLQTASGCTRRADQDHAASLQLHTEGRPCAERDLRAHQIEADEVLP